MMSFTRNDSDHSSASTIESGQVNQVGVGLTASDLSTNHRIESHYDHNLKGIKSLDSASECEVEGAELRSGDKKEEELEILDEEGWEDVDEDGWETDEGDSTDEEEDSSSSESWHYNCRLRFPYERTDGWKIFHIYVLYNNLENVASQISQGVNVNEMTVGENSCSALHISVKHRDSKILKLLLEHGADPNIRDCDGYAALQIAAKIRNTAAIRVLAQYGADANATSHSGWNALSSASYDGNLAVIQELLRAGASVGKKDRFELNPVYRMAERGHRECLLEMLKHCEKTGETAFLSDLNGGMATPLHMAVDFRFKDCVEYLVKLGADPNVGIYGSPTDIPVLSAIGTGDMDYVKLLLPGTSTDLMNQCTRGPFYYALRSTGKDSIEILKYLLQSGVDLNSMNNVYDSDNYYDSSNFKMFFDIRRLFGHEKRRTSLGELAMMGGDLKLEYARLLLDAGARIDPISNVEHPTLVFALEMSSNADTGLPRLLIERGASVNLYHDDYIGNLSVMICLNNFKALNFILNAGAEVDSLFQNVSGSTCCLLCSGLKALRDIESQIRYLQRGRTRVSGAGVVQPKPPSCPVSFWTLLASIKQKSDIPRILLKLLEYTVAVSLTCEQISCAYDRESEDWKKICNILSQPRSLQEMCRVAVRRTLPSSHLISPSSLNTLLPLPQRLINYLTHSSR